MGSSRTSACSTTDGIFSRADFSYDHEGDVYFCPAGKMLICKGTLVNDGATLLYRASRYDCDVCALKSQRCPNAPARKVPRSVYEGARDVARDIAKSEEGRTSRKQIEMLFAHLKRIMRLDRLRLRGPNGACDEFHLAATAHNRRKLAKPISMRELAAASDQRQKPSCAPIENRGAQASAIPRVCQRNRPISDPGRVPIVPALLTQSCR